MAFELSRIDRLIRTYDLAATLPGGGPVTITGVEVALLPPRGAPTAATPWVDGDYAEGEVTVLLAGPDADSTDALVVPASADLWMKVADSPEVDAVKIERITLLGGGGVIELPSDSDVAVAALLNDTASATYLKVIALIEARAGFGGTP